MASLKARGAEDFSRFLLLVPQDPDGNPKQPRIHDNGGGTYLVSYIPDRTGRYTIVIKYGGDDIPASPFRVRATATGDASKCSVSGTEKVRERESEREKRQAERPFLHSGVGPTVAIGQEMSLAVNTKGAGKGKVCCVVVQPDGSEVEAEVVENPDGTFDIFYTAPAPGNYVIFVRFGGENIPRSPFKVMVRTAFLPLPVPSCSQHQPEEPFPKRNGRKYSIHSA